MAAPTYVTSTAAVAATTTTAPTYPASNIDDLLLMIVLSDSSGIGSAPAGWTQIGSVQSGGGLSMAAWWRISTGTESGTQTVSITGGTKGASWMSSYRPTVVGSRLSIASSTQGSDTDATSTALSITGAASLACAVDDRVLVPYGTITTASVYSGASGWGQAVAVSGATLSNTARFVSSTSGATIVFGLIDAAVTAAGTNPPAFTATTNSGTNGAGSAQFPLLRESVPSPISISYVGDSAWVAPASSATVSPTYPSGIQAGDVVYAELVIKPDTATVATPTDWAKVGESASMAGGTAGAGTGPMKVHLYRRVASAGHTGSVSFTITGGSSPAACMRAFRPQSGAVNVAWLAETTTSYSRTTGSTTFGGTGAANLALGPKDAMVFVSASSDDQSSTHTISALAATGMTFGSVTQAPSGTAVNAQGNDMSAAAAYVLASAGTSSAAPTSTVTGSSAETGGGFFYRVRATGDFTGALPQVTQTQTAATLTGAKAGDLPQVTETQVAQTLTGEFSGATGDLPRVTETQTAQALTAAKDGALPGVTETSSAATLTGSKAADAPQAPETDLAGALTGSKSGDLPRPGDSEVSQSLTGAKTGSLSAASEADSALPLTGAVSITPAVETSTATSPTGTKAGALSAVTEADTARTLTSATAGTLPAATATETPGALAAAKTGTLPRATETGTASTLSGAKTTAAVPQPAETDAATALSGTKAGTLSSVSTTEVARTLSGSIEVGGVLPKAMSTELARELTGAKSAILAGGEAAYPGGIHPGPSTFPGGNPGILVTDDAAPLTGEKVGSLVLVLTTDSAGDFTGGVGTVSTLPRATEVSVAQVFGGAVISEVIQHAVTEDIAIPLFGLKDGGLLPRVLEVSVALALAVGPNLPPVLIPTTRTLKRLTKPNVLVSMTHPNTLEPLGVARTLTPTTGGTP